MSLNFLDSNKLKTGFGNEIVNATSYEDALNQSGLNWTVSMRDAYADFDGKKILIPGQKVVVRDIDQTPLGIVSDKYKPVDNVDALMIMDSIIDTGEVVPLRGGSYGNGKKVWIETRINKDFNVFGDDLDCYLIFMNSHDGSGSIKCMIVPERRACLNVMNFPLRGQARYWRCIHTGNPKERIEEAKQILLAGSKYMDQLTRSIEMLSKIKIPYEKVNDLIAILFPIDSDMSVAQVENTTRRRNQLLEVFLNKEDLSDFDSNGYKFMSAVADYADHCNGKKTKNAAINRWMMTTHGHPLVDRAFNIVISL